jgi:hypothetical protein
VPALTRIRGAYYESPSGLRVGIAYAHEKEQNGKWFLGLDDGAFEHAVLLCESKNGDMVHLSLPREFVGKCGPLLAKVNKQRKFNVASYAGEYFLLVPGQGRVSLSPYLDNYKGLR